MENDRMTHYSEFTLIDWIQKQQEGNGKHLSLGIGDDCSIQPQQAHYDLLTSTDLLIENIHFNCNWTTMFDLGRKAAAVNISDIAAMGGTPQSLFLGLGRPKTINDKSIENFISGFLAEITTHGAVLAGGDTCGSPGSFMVSVTVQGTIVSGSAICRRGARPGDSIYVSGTLGDSALALQQLQRSRQPDLYLGQRFHTPTPRVTLGQMLSQQHLVTAMVDVSDGLLGDLGHILTASAVGAELELSLLPLSTPFQRALNNTPTLIDLALAGGEDYELLFTSPQFDLAARSGFDIPVTRIGTITSEPELRIHQTDGSLYHCHRSGFDHFG